jgi:aromatic ring-cleaving dioxygenase
MADDILKHLTGSRQSLQPIYSLHFSSEQFGIFCQWLSVGSAMADYLLQSETEAPSSSDNFADFIMRHVYADKWLQLSQKLLPVLETMTSKQE